MTQPPDLRPLLVLVVLLLLAASAWLLLGVWLPDGAPDGSRGR